MEGWTDPEPTGYGTPRAPDRGLSVGEKGTHE